MWGFLGVMLFIFVVCEIGLESFGEFASCEHNPPPASLAFEADIRAEPRDSPLIGTTGMLFTESQVVVEVEVEGHGWRFLIGNW